MQPRWGYGDSVRVVRNVRNDGTHPSFETGELLVPRGSIGHVINVGTFLQDQIIYSVHFLDLDRIVGCREEELIDIDEAWTPSKFETRQTVRAAIPLALRGELLVAVGSRGEVLRVVRDAPDGVAYHVHFECLKGRPLMVPEDALQSLEETSDA